MRKFRFCLMAVLCVAGLTFASCGGDDDEPESTEQGGGNSGGSGNTGGADSGKNPVAGKTIRCVETKKNDFVKVSTNFAITFTAKEFTKVLKQTAEEYDMGTGKWEETLNLDVVYTGTYTFTSDRIVCSYSDGGSFVLNKVSGGWDEDGYIYK